MKKPSKPLIVQEPVKEPTRNVVTRIHVCDLGIAPKLVDISFGPYGSPDEKYLFSLYVNESGRYIAYSRGREDFFGEGANWWLAISECMHKILQNKKEQ